MHGQRLSVCLSLSLSYQSSCSEIDEIKADLHNVMSDVMLFILEYLEPSNLVFWWVFSEGDDVFFGCAT